MSLLISKEELEQQNQAFAQSSPQKILSWALDHALLRGKIVLACSMSAEDCVLLHMCHEIDPSIRVVVLDTGRLHEESYETLERCRERYAVNIECFFPDTNLIQNLLRTKGLFSFYESVEARKECCYIRKVEPLKRALHAMKAWIAGLRHEHSAFRRELQFLAFDEANQALLKISPLLHWTWDEVLHFARKNKVPLHPLHAKNYLSIGCAPCTRAVSRTQDFRSGRWWWEDDEHKECGLHQAAR